MTNSWERKLWCRCNSPTPVPMAPSIFKSSMTIVNSQKIRKMSWNKWTSACLQQALFKESARLSKMATLMKQLNRSRPMIEWSKKYFPKNRRKNSSTSLTQGSEIWRKFWILRKARKTKQIRKHRKTKQTKETQKHYKNKLNKSNTKDKDF